jgi:TonB family protein
LELPAEATEIPSGSQAPEASLAIAGLNPIKAPDFVPPTGSKKGGFSAGPQPVKEGGDGSSSGNAIIVVPGLMARGGERDERPVLVAHSAPTSRENIAAAMRAAAVAPVTAEPKATRVTSAPDPRFDGRAVYTIAIQMPNVTSYSGSWIVWYAEHQPLPGSSAFEFRAPVPLHKVDPKYIAAAASERVEGKVRLFAIIRKDGHVESVELIEGVDERLNRSASEALAKWQFEPARRDGTPIDVDAVFEIPFHLAPLPIRK